MGGATTDCRGADTQAEFDRQWPKTVAAITALDADVVGFNEIENDGYGPDSAIAFLVDKLNAATAPGTYAFIDADAATGQVNALGTDAIKVGMIYKPAVVTPVGQTAVLNSVAFVNGGDSAPRSRPSLAPGLRGERHRRPVPRRRQPPEEQGQRLRCPGRRRRPGQLQPGARERGQRIARLARDRSHRHRRPGRPDAR